MEMQFEEMIDPDRIIQKLKEINEKLKNGRYEFADTSDDRYSDT